MINNDNGKYNIVTVQFLLIVLVKHFAFLQVLTHVTKGVIPVFCTIFAKNVEHTFAMCAKSIQKNLCAVQIRVLILSHIMLRT